MRFRSTLWAMMLCGLVLAADPALGDLPIGLSVDLTLVHDGETRTYDVLRPGSAPGLEPRALVVDVHGFSSNGDQQRSLSNWQSIAESDGILVAWPDGLDNSWNAGTCCGAAVTNNVDDVGFIRAMVAAIQAEASIDPGRIYVTGLSNGGAMTQRLACEAADLFAAAAPMAFPVPYTNFAAQCLPSESIPILSFMGLTDALVSYAGAAPSFAGWRDKNGCDSGGTPVETTEIYGGSSCEIDTSCGEVGLEVGLCSVRGTAFGPPLEIFSGHILYINDDAFDLSQRAWEFMRDYRRTPFAPVPLSGGAWMLAIALAGMGALMLKSHRSRSSDSAGRRFER
jgi:polyhydroxybutyrate depolymerase